MSKTVRSGVITSIILVVTGVTIGAFTAASSQQSLWAGGLTGAGTGLAVALVVFIHLVVRALFGRVPESRTEGLAPHSVERDVFRRAGERALPDIFSLMLAGALIAAFLPGEPILRWIPALVTVCALITFAIRALSEWQQLVRA